MLIANVRGVNINYRVPPLHHGPGLRDPGSHWTLPHRVGENASCLLPNGELHVLMPQDAEVDIFSEGWDEKRDPLA